MKPSSSALWLGAVLAACTLGGCKDRTTDAHTTTTTETVPAPAPVPSPVPAPAPATPSATPPDNGTTTAPPGSPAPATAPPSSGTSGTSGTSGATGSGTDAYGDPVNPGIRNDNPDNMPRRGMPPQR